MAITKWIPFALNYILTSKLFIKNLGKIVSETLSTMRSFNFTVITKLNVGGCQESLREEEKDNSCTKEQNSF